MAIKKRVTIPNEVAVVPPEVLDAQKYLRLLAEFYVGLVVSDSTVDSRPPITAAANPDVVKAMEFFDLRHELFNKLTHKADGTPTPGFFRSPVPVLWLEHAMGALCSSAFASVSRARERDGHAPMPYREHYDWVSRAHLLYAIKQIETSDSPPETEIYVHHFSAGANLGRIVQTAYNDGLAVMDYRYERMTQAALASILRAIVARGEKYIDRIAELAMREWATEFADYTRTRQQEIERAKAIKARTIYRRGGARLKRPS